MKAEDIIWGGNNKCPIRLKRDINLEPGTLVELNYDYTKEEYTLVYGADRVDLVVSENVKEFLDNIYLTGSVPTTMVRVIDRGTSADEKLEYLIEIKIFQSLVTFDELSSITIKIGDSIIDKMRVKDKEDPIGYLNRAFKYGDRLFVKGYGNGKGKAFTLLSTDRALHVRMENGEYVAVNLVRYDKQKAEDDAVYILKGQVSFVDSSHTAFVSAEVSKKMDAITSAGEYFDIWDAYNDLDRIFAFKQATENGVIPYTSCTHKLTDAFEYCFEVSVDDADIFPDGAVIDCTDDDEILNIDKFQQADQFKQIHSVAVGVFDRIEDGKIYIVDRESDIQKRIPSQGYLFLSVMGDAVRLSRREKAKSEIVTNQTPIHDLARLIDKGVATGVQTKHEIPVTNMLTRKFPDKDFNEDQRKAIEVAINTPDIALIMGPPGTGKTTVIKAIIARYEEYYKKYNDKKIPKILVTSFQHEAVENVIVDLDGNGLPSDRKGGKRNGQDKKDQSIKAWRNKMDEYIDKEVRELVPEETKTIKLRDEIFAWNAKGKDAAEGFDLLRAAAEGCRLQLSNHLNEEINEVLSRALGPAGYHHKEVEAIIDGEQDEIRKVLFAQRTSMEAYEDDGKRQAFVLKQLILQDIISNNQDTEFIDNMLADKGRDKNSFNEYVKGVEELKNKYSVKEKVNTTISTEDVIEQCLKQMDSELEQQRLKRLENRDEATAYILKNYLDAIQDEKEVERIISKYSNVTAATCQQAMEVGRFAQNHTYDLVIVDEAARANPLDLLIPMSMGRQVILVGDHKQLPHMLDPEVVKQFEKDERMQDLGILQKSLFERLFEMFDDNSQTVKRTAMLSKQYRMHPVIGTFASYEFYNKQLDSSEIKEETKQANLDMYNNQPVAWINLDKNKFGMEAGGQSKYRESEAKRVVEETRKVLAKDPKKTVGIISFYRKQSDLILKMIGTELTDTQRDQVEVGTVDAFQGKEFDVVFLSCVRANVNDIENRRKRIGHLDDQSRLCVSFTRARQQLVVTGDRDTVECVPALADYIKMCKKGGSYFG